MSKKTKVGDSFELKAEHVNCYSGTLCPGVGRKAQGTFNYIKTQKGSDIKCIYVDELPNYNFYFFEIMNGPDAGKVIFDYGAGLRNMYKRK